MQRKYQKLEKSWDDVEKRIMQDAEYLKVNFANEVRNANINILYILAK